MSRTALGKLDEAKQLRKMANETWKGDPEIARGLKELASRKAKQALKQMKPRRKSRANLRTVR